jgi:acetyl esterase
MSLKILLARMLIGLPRSLAALWYFGRLDKVDSLTIDPKAQLVGRLINSFRVPGQLPTVPEARRQLEMMFRLFDAPGPIAETKDIAIPGPDGTIPARAYIPEERPAGDANDLPVLAYFHGGGWIQGSLDSHDGVCRRLAAWAGCLVVSVDYRLAPEHPFPAAVDDCLAAYGWLADNAGELGGDKGRIAVGGDSAGGNLAAVVSQLCRDWAMPMPVMQVLFYPGIDFHMDTPSHRSLADTYMLTRERIDWYVSLYLRDAKDKDDPRASPIRARSLAGLPPALVMTAGFDPLRDEGHDYAKALEAAGVPADYRLFEGMIHAFVSMPAAFKQADEALCAAADALKIRFAEKG